MGDCHCCRQLSKPWLSSHSHLLVLGGGGWGAQLGRTAGLLWSPSFASGLKHWRNQIWKAFYFSLHALTIIL